VVTKAWARRGCLPLRIRPQLTDAELEKVSPFLAPLVGQMAQTGIGTDHCLAHQGLPMPVHFYSPVPDLADLERRGVWDQRSELVGLDFNVGEQLKLLQQLGGSYSAECNWPTAPAADRGAFYTENSSFSYSCAAPLHCLIRCHKPRRLVEVGSGNSSLVISAALTLNKHDQPEAKTEYTIVDPYPNSRIKNGLPCLTQLIQQPVESLPLPFFSQLGRGDILFIDSGHTVRIGSDVNFLILEVLPRLAPGVLIHFHDIPMPGEYSKGYATNSRFRQFWTESYLLQAFLCFNSQFEILLAMGHLMANHRDAFQRAFPLYDPARHLLTSQSFWIRRK